MLGRPLTFWSRSFWFPICLFRVDFKLSDAPVWQRTESYDWRWVCTFECVCYTSWHALPDALWHGFRGVYLCAASSPSPSFSFFFFFTVIMPAFSCRHVGSKLRWQTFMTALTIAVRSRNVQKPRFNGRWWIFMLGFSQNVSRHLFPLGNYNRKKTWSRRVKQKQWGNKGLSDK